MTKNKSGFSLNDAKVIPLAAMRGDDEEDSKLLGELAENAINYIQSHKWCQRLVKSYFGLGIGGIVAVFLFEIIPSDDKVDNYIWIIVGDIPPLYIAGTDAPNPACALDGYIGAMEEWAKAAIAGKTISGLPPVAAEATPENGKRLLKRLDWLDKNILRYHEDDLKCGFRSDSGDT